MTTISSSAYINHELRSKAQAITLSLYLALNNDSSEKLRRHIEEAQEIALSMCTDLNLTESNEKHTSY